MVSGARSAGSAAAAFAAAATVSLAYFTLSAGAIASSLPQFSEADRQAAFDGEPDWQAAMHDDAATAPIEPAAHTDIADTPLDSAEKSAAVFDGDNEPVALDPDSGSSIVEGIVEGVVDGIGSILGSIFD